MLFVSIVLPVFLIIVAGFVLEKVARLDFRALTTPALYLFTPALVFASLMKREVRYDLAVDLGLFMLLYTALLLALSVALGRMLRMDREMRGALSLTTVMMNVGNFGLPLAYFAFGDAGLDISILTFVLFNIPLGTLAIVIAQGGRSPLAEALLNTLRIPIFHAVAAAFLCKALALRIPAFLLDPIDLLGQAAIPLMLVLLGMQLARTRLQAQPVFLVLSCAVRLGLAPLLAWGLCLLLGISGLARDVLVLQTSTPSAVLPLLYSLRFKTRPDLVASAILASTVLSGLSLTAILYLQQ